MSARQLWLLCLYGGDEWARIVHDMRVAPERLEHVVRVVLLGSKLGSVLA